MADTIVRVCFAAMQSGQPLTLEDFGDQFVSDGAERGITKLRQARGQPWVRIRLNGSRPGLCSANFSDAGITGDSYRTASLVADNIRQLYELRPASVPGMRASFTFENLDHAFDPERDPFIGYLPVAGFQTFIFMPAGEPTPEEASR
ncbi:MAG: hypothetical protein JNL81_06455 [Hyphomonadaceae bacterium]|nr:hypothetical protein [Hyphomonadaceae bacterium]